MIYFRFSLITFTIFLMESNVINYYWYQFKAHQTDYILFHKYIVSMRSFLLIKLLTLCFFIVAINSLSTPSDIRPTTKYGFTSNTSQYLATMSIQKDTILALFDYYTLTYSKPFSNFNYQCAITIQSAVFSPKTTLISQCYPYFQ